MKHQGFTLDTPLKLKAGSRGKFEVAIDIKERGAVLPVISLRNALLMGLPPKEVRLTKPIRIHKLLDGQGLVTSDSPQELFTQQISFSSARGKVLVGGLGIGMATTMIANMKGVEGVVTVEIESDVVKLVEHQLPETKAPSRVINDDIYDYLQRGEAKFDYAYLDIWSGTNEGTWDEHVVPLKRLIARKYGPDKVVTCWMENEMKSQIAMSVMGVVTAAGDEQWVNAFRPKWVFRQALNRSRLSPEQLAKIYVGEIGSILWEKLFPWDEFKKEAYANG